MNENTLCENCYQQINYRMGGWTESARSRGRTDESRWHMLPEFSPQSSSLIPLTHIHTHAHSPKRSHSSLTKGQDLKDLKGNVDYALKEPN